MFIASYRRMLCTGSWLQVDMRYTMTASMHECGHGSRQAAKFDRVWPLRTAGQLIGLEE